MLTSKLLAIYFYDNFDDADAHPDLAIFLTSCGDRNFHILSLKKYFKCMFYA